MSSQEPMVEMLGTPAEHKRRIVYDTRLTRFPDRTDSRERKLAGPLPRTREAVTAHIAVEQPVR
jgi:hypothetical protein